MTASKYVSVTMQAANGLNVPASGGFRQKGRRIEAASMSQWKIAFRRCGKCWGELLLEANEPEQALKEFEASLRNNPNRYRSFAGAAKAAERTGDRAQVNSYCEKLVALTGNAQTVRPDALKARQYLARQ